MSRPDSFEIPAPVRITMELSGCDAVFVRADADLDRVVRSLEFGLRLNGGETCIAPRRVFVARSLMTELEKRLGGLIDASGSLLGIPVQYRDSRNDDQMEAAFSRIPQEELYSATGNQFMSFNTVFQLLAEQERNPARLEAAERILGDVASRHPETAAGAAAQVRLAEYGLGEPLPLDHGAHRPVQNEDALA